MIWVDERIFAAWKYVDCIALPLKQSNLEWIVCVHSTYCFHGFQNRTKTLNAVERKHNCIAFIVCRLVDWHLDNKLYIWSEWRRIRIYSRSCILFQTHTLTLALTAHYTFSWCQLVELDKWVSIVTNNGHLLEHVFSLYSLCAKNIWINDE